MTGYHPYVKAESIKSKPIKSANLYLRLFWIPTTARRQKERGKKNEEKIISSRNEYGICNRNVSRMRKQHKETSTKDTKSTEAESKDSIPSDFPVCGHGSLDNCREGFLGGLKKQASKKERT